MKTDMQLADGSATHMGEGVYVIRQKDEQGKAHSVVLTPGDLQVLLDRDRLLAGG